MKHPLDLVIPSFAQNDSGFSGAEDLEFGRESGDVFRRKVEALRKAGDGFFRDILIGFDKVYFFDLPAGEGEGFGPGSIVREEDESGGGPIESTCKMKRVFVRVVDQVKDRSMDRVGGGTEDTRGFVKHQVKPGKGLLEDFATGGYFVKTAHLAPMVVLRVPGHGNRS